MHKHNLMCVSIPSLYIQVSSYCGYCVSVMMDVGYCMDGVSIVLWRVMNCCRVRVVRSEVL